MPSIPKNVRLGIGDTICLHPMTDGVQTWINPTGNVALATAGSGDVLTGVIAGLIGQFFKGHLGGTKSTATPPQPSGLSLFECARIGVYLHGLAADRWAERNGDSGLLATDLLAELPAAQAELRNAQ